MSDITGKDFNIKPLLVNVSKEVNICVGRILHKADLDAFTGIINYKEQLIQSTYQ